MGPHRLYLYRSWERAAGSPSGDTAQRDDRTLGRGDGEGPAAAQAPAGQGRVGTYVAAVHTALRWRDPRSVPVDPGRPSRTVDRGWSGPCAISDAPPNCSHAEGRENASKPPIVDAIWGVQSTKWRTPRALIARWNSACAATPTTPSPRRKSSPSWSLSPKKSTPTATARQDRDSDLTVVKHPARMGFRPTSESVG